MPWYPDCRQMVLAIALIVTAGLAYRIAKGNITQAVHWFNNTLESANLPKPANAWDYVGLWGPRLDDDGRVEGRSELAGRPPKLSPQHVETAYEGALAWRSHGRTEPYASEAELATDCPEFKQVLDETGVNATTLIKRIRDVHPHFKRAKLHGETKLTAKHEEKRLAVCKVLLSLEVRLLLRVVFLDAKTIMLNDKDIYGWVDMSKEHSFIKSKPPRYDRHIISIKYYAAVNAVLGPVWICYYTGTSGILATHDGKDYKVSLRNKELWCIARLHMQQCLPQLSLPGGRGFGLCASTTFIHLQNAETSTLCSLCQCLITRPPFFQGVIRVLTLSNKPINMTLSLHLNQQVGWVHNIHIPGVTRQVNLYAARLCLHRHHTRQWVCLHSIPLN